MRLINDAPEPKSELSPAEIEHEITVHLDKELEKLKYEHGLDWQIVADIEGGEVVGAWLKPPPPVALKYSALENLEMTTEFHAMAYGLMLQYLRNLSSEEPSIVKASVRSLVTQMDTAEKRRKR